MPELPEAEVVARQLRAVLPAAVIKDIWVGRPDIVRQGLETLDWYRGTTVETVERHGKSVVLGLQRGGERRYLLAELGMTGLLLFGSPAPSYRKHTHLVLTLDAAGPPAVGELHYWNPRRFGRVHLLDAAGLARFCRRRFGPDPLTVDRATFAALIKGSRGRLKALLLQQPRLAGIGNIYANEILHRAGLHPHVRGRQLTAGALERLHRAVQEVLAEGIAAGGSTIRDFRAPDGRMGRFQEFHRVYGKAGQPCQTCGAAIRRLAAERSSFYCPQCQRRAPAPRRRGDGAMPRPQRTR